MGHGQAVIRRRAICVPNRAADVVAAMGSGTACRLSKNHWAIRLSCTVPGDAARLLLRAAYEARRRKTDSSVRTGTVAIEKHAGALRVSSGGIDPTATGLGMCGAHADIDGRSFLLWAIARVPATRWRALLIDPGGRHPRMAWIHCAAVGSALERRVPVRSTGSRMAGVSFGYFSFRAERKVTPMNACARHSNNQAEEARGATRRRQTHAAATPRTSPPQRCWKD